MLYIINTAMWTRNLNNEQTVKKWNWGSGNVETEKDMPILWQQEQSKTENIERLWMKREKKINN